MVISVNYRQSICQIQNLSVITVSQKTREKKELDKIISSKNLTLHLIMKRSNLSHLDQVQSNYISSHHCFQIILEALSNTIIQEKGLRSIQIGNKDIQVSLLADGTIIYVVNLKQSTKTPLMIAKMKDKRLTCQNKLPSYIPTMNSGT